MQSVRRFIPGTLLLLPLCSLAAAQPVITSVNSAELPRSGRVAITGFGFGSGGEVFIAGLSAWTTTWTGTRIVAYVPESAPLGPAPLYVVAQGQQSNEVPLSVTSRRSDGRVKWTFEADGSNLWYRPALAPDGTIYLHTNNETNGVVYALSPDGGLLWTQRVIWYPYVPPMAGPDGTLYVGSIATTYAISRQGQILWEFVDHGAQGIQVAPTIGPDGLLYGAYDVGMGAFALDPATGQLQWSNPGVPYMYDYGNPFGTEVKFGPSRPGEPINQMYVHMDRRGDGRLYAFTLDGQQRFAVSVTGSVSHEPVVGSNGTVYTPVFGGSFGWGVMAIDPDSGQLLWIYDPANGNGVSELEIGPDDTLYFVSPGHLEAVNPHTVSQRWLNRNYLVMGRPSLSPDGATLILDGVPNYGQPGFIKGFDAATGQETWNVDLPGEPYPGFRVLGTHHPRFTLDGRTAYVSTYTLGSPFGDPRSYLYALSVMLPGDWDEDGDVDLIDYEAYLDCAGGPGGGVSPGCETFDFDEDQDVDFADAAAFQSAFTGSLGF